MISCAKSGNQRLLEIECHAHSILWSHRRLAPCARLDIVEATGAEESPDRSALVRGARPAPHNPPAADPPSLGSSGLQLPLQESSSRSATAHSPGARGYRPGVSGCVAWGFRESGSDGKSDCTAISGSSCYTRVRKTSSHSKICMAIPDDSMEAFGGLRPDGATGWPQ